MKKILTISFAVLVLFSISGLSFVSANGIEQTREQCIDFIISNSTIDYSLQETSVLDDFVDATSVTNDFTLKKVSAAVDKGILKGYEDKTLRLDEKVTRAEFACMIYRAKDYYMPCTDIVTYKGNYTDLADWNQNEIIYCIENGFLMGYGNKFGSEDYITAEQMSIVGTRLKYGLSTREKYSLMNVCGVCPIPFDTMIASAYDDEIINYDLKTSGLQEDTSVSKETTTAKLIDMLDMLGNLDCDKLKNVEYETYQKKDFLFRIPSPLAQMDPETGLITSSGSDVPYEISLSGTRTNIEEILDEAKNNNTKRESIHVLAPQGSYEGVLYTAYRIRKGCGYEYFMYTQGDILPDGIELNRWYRRKFVVEHGENMRQGQEDYLYVTYETHEKA